MKAYEIQKQKKIEQIDADEQVADFTDLGVYIYNAICENGKPLSNKEIDTYLRDHFSMRLRNNLIGFYNLDPYKKIACKQGLYLALNKNTDGADYRVCNAIRHTLERYIGSFDKYTNDR